MATNNTISQVEVNGVTYDLLDTNTLSAVSALNTRVTALENSVANKASTADSIKNITRSDTTFTATRANGTTFTFTQQDNNTVTSVKGDKESSYRTGNVNLTPANLGAVSVSPGWGLNAVEASYYNNNISFVFTLDNGNQFNVNIGTSGVSYYHRNNSSQG